MIKTVLSRTIAHPAVAAVCALLAACTSYSAPVPAVQAIPPRPTPDEVADYSTAQMQYRYGLATGNGEARTRRERCPRCTSSRSWTAKFA